MRRPLLLSALLVSSSFAGTGAPAEYVSGTVKTIPANTNGALDAGSELTFRYGKSVFTLPYEKITNTEITEPSAHHLWKVPVPKVVGRGERLLNISYRDGGDSRLVTFKGSANALKEVVDTIDAHRKESQALSFTPRPPAKPVVEDWWGDKYWRTTRNKNKWPEIPQDNAAPGVPAGSKE